MRKRTLKGALRYAIVAGGAAVALLLASGSAWASPPTYYPSGPQSNVDQSTLVGWTQCWTSTYASNEPLADILAACPGDYLLLAAGPVSSGVFDVIAAAPRADVIFDTGSWDLYTVHDANGSGWYFNSSWSWGFAKQGAAVYKYSCDITDTGWVDPVNLVTGAY